MPHVVLWKLLVGEVFNIEIRRSSNKKLDQSIFLNPCLFQYNYIILNCIINNTIQSKQVKMQSNYSRFFGVHWVGEKMSHCLGGSNVISTEILFDFIAIFFQSHCCFIMAFVNMFDRLHGCAHLNVDVTMIFVNKTFIVRDDKTIIETKMLLRTSTIIMTLVQRIALCIYTYMFLKNAWRNVWCIDHLRQDNFQGCIDYKSCASKQNKTRRGVLFSFENLI